MNEPVTDVKKYDINRRIYLPKWVEEDLGLVPIIPSEHAHGLNWQSIHNPVSIEKRILRRILIQEHCINLKYTVWNADMHLKRIKASYEKIKNKTY